jgi:hypothetical protein
MSDTKDYLEFVKESFDPQLISALYKNFSNQYIALLELLDNAVDDRLVNQKLKIAVQYDADEKKLIIKNVNGSGLDTQGIQKFFTWGKGRENPDRIGRYGQGGKAAIGYLAQSFIIRSHPIDSPNGYLIKVDDWEDREKGFKEFKIEPFRMLDRAGSVTFELSNLKKSFSTITIKSKIEEIYRPLIVSGKVEFIVNSDTVECTKANYDEGTKTSFSIPFSNDGKSYTLYGEYGIVSDKNSPRGGFNVYQFGRLVAKKEYFGHIDPSKRWNVERLYGELHVDFEIPLLMNKTDIDRDSKSWREIVPLMKNEIEPAIRLAIDYKTPTKREESAIKQVGNKIKDELKENKSGLELSNYGSTILYKVKNGFSGENKLIINRGHPAYQYWSETSVGEKLYIVMIYSLYRSVTGLSKSDGNKLHMHFSESLIQQIRKMRGEIS